MTERSKLAFKDKEAGEKLACNSCEGGYDNARYTYVAVEGGESDGEVVCPGCLSFSLRQMWKIHERKKDMEQAQLHEIYGEIIPKGVKVIV